MRRSILLAFLVTGLAAFQGDGSEPCAVTSLEAVASPLAGLESCFEAAGRPLLAQVEPVDRPGLHNVFKLSGNVISGSEPATEAAFQKLADMGVRTILSVDGKAPDAETARRFGIRYVHVPIQYKGISDEEMARIAKTFHEAEAPFYIHCFHGRHRGPAAAAVGRLILDGISREQALAEMRQWCGTSEEYQGLYEAVGRTPIPSVAQALDYEWDFPVAARLNGFRDAMVGASRTFDNLLMLQENGWKADAGHPDVDPANEAAILAGLFEAAGRLEFSVQAPEDFRALLRESAADARRLQAFLSDGNSAATMIGGDADRTMGRMDQNCGACHAAYRNR